MTTLTLSAKEYDLLLAAMEQYHLAAVFASHWKDAPNQRRLARKVMPRIEALKARLKAKADLDRREEAGPRVRTRP